MLQNYQDVRIVVYGDLMVDQYYSGPTYRLSPEAPIPVVQVEHNTFHLGGAANVALNLASLGCQTHLFGIIGADTVGEKLVELATAQKINLHVQKTPLHPTIHKLRVIGQHQQLLRLDFEKNYEGIDSTALETEFLKTLQNAHILILSDYAKGTLHNIKNLIQIAKSLGVPILIDPKGNDFNRYAGCTLLTPNLKEFETIVGACHSEAELVHKARCLIDRLNIEALLVTQGKAGMTLIPKGRDAYHVNATAQDVFDVTGAGDTAIAVLAAQLALGATPETATQIANLAAGLVVTKLGTTPISLQELQNACAAETVGSPNRLHAKILQLEDALSQVTLAKQRHETIVMTNGCFDVLHAGHVYYLERAKAKGHKLLVAINTDESIRRLKGPHRPLNPLSARLEVLAGLEAVDWVVPFAEDTPYQLISKILPDVLIKGADYQITEIAGHDIVLQQGGRVETIPLKPGFSTSALIQKMQKETTA